MIASQTDTTLIKKSKAFGFCVGSLAFALMTSAGAMAADLPFFPAGPSQFQAGPPRGTFGGDRKSVV